MANSRIPHDYMESIIKSSLPPQLRVLHWFYRNYFGWEKNRKNGFMKIKSFSKIAEEIGIDKSRLNRVLNNLSELGFFDVDFKEKTFYLSKQKVVKFSNFPKEKKLSNLATKSCQKEQQKVVKYDNQSCQKEQLLSGQSLDNTGVYKTLKHSLKQELKQDLKTGEQNSIQPPPFEVTNFGKNYDDLYDDPVIKEMLKTGYFDPERDCFRDLIIMKREYLALAKGK